MVAMGMPRGSEEEKSIRRAALQAATLEAARVPLQVAETACAALPFIKTMAESGNPASASDAAVGALCARTAVVGACLNVQTNLPGLDDATERESLRQAAERLEARATMLEAEILAIARSRIG
jgi:glutamate formiminotransferase/formiminotetrahydrofolate cyclodeaminase